MPLIAIVEDAEDHREVFYYLLRDQYEVVAYENGSEAMDGFSRSKPDLIIMHVETLKDLMRLFETADREQSFPPSAMRVIRGKTTGVQKKISLPAGFLDDLEDATPPEGADIDTGDGG